jgi:hypothetical protein
MLLPWLWWLRLLAALASDPLPCPMDARRVERLLVRVRSGVLRDDTEAGLPVLRWEVWVSELERRR